jgi:hypothetical protein
MRRATCWCALIAAVGCQGRKAAPAGGEQPVAAAGADASESPPVIEADAGDEGSAAPAAGSGSVTEDPTISSGGDTPSDEPGKGTGTSTGTGAVPAWQAVIDRDRYLARRSQKGVIEGRVGGPVASVGPLVVDAGLPPPDAIAAMPPPADAAPADGAPVMTWLVDDTEGDGSLAIRVAFRGAAPAAGARVAISGSWALDEDRRWYWAAEDVTPLPAGPPVTDAAPPGHVIAIAGYPQGTRPIARAGDGGGVVSFMVLAPPLHEGDGWIVANEIGDPPFARLILPGERSSYGGHDLRQADERWQLKRGTAYWIRIGKIRRPAARPGETQPPLPIVRAVGAPRRVL